jgi:hypothetical protein
MTCTTICYACDYLNQGTHIDSFCSDGIRSIDLMNQAVTQYQQMGYTCRKIAPNKTLQYCDDNKPFINYLDSTGLICQ